MKNLFLMAVLLLSTFGAKADEITGVMKVAEDKTTATLYVSLANNLNYIGFQMDFTLPEGWEVTDAAPAGSERLDGEGDGTAMGDTKFNVKHNVIGGNKVRIVAYNLANEIIKDNEDNEIFRIDMAKSEAAEYVDSWTATVSDIIFVCKDEDGITSKDEDMAVSNDDSTVIGEGENSGTSTKVNAAVSQNTVKDVYGMNGVRQHALQNGLNIVKLADRVIKVVVK